jgi:hypothetical protein
MSEIKFDTAKFCPDCSRHHWTTGPCSREVRPGESLEWLIDGMTDTYKYLIKKSLCFKKGSHRMLTILALAREALSFRKKYGMSFDEWEEVKEEAAHE